MRKPPSSPASKRNEMGEKEWGRRLQWTGSVRLNLLSTSHRRRFTGMPIYCQIDGITGDATHQNHQKWMDIQSLHWNVSRHMNTIAGSAANREATEPNISE